MKRKGSKPGEHTSKKKKVDAETEGKEDDSTRLSFKSPKECFTSLLSVPKDDNSIDTVKFFAEYWEKKHLHIKRGDPEYYGSMFDLEGLYQILKTEEINYEIDVNVCRYVNQEKELLNGEGQASDDEIKKKMADEKATIQFHQPQRFVDILWKLMENLERYFGCIFGSNCYITPPKAQGLAPHCDDVEVLILQLEGKKQWTLYDPIDELSRHYSPDLLDSEIGKPMAEITMETGDLLYFPRGTIHQAKTIGDSHSTHLTLSTYQNNTYGDLLSAAIKHCLDEAIDNDVEFRRGLPINFLSHLGTGRNVSSYVNPVETNGDTPSEDQEEVEVYDKDSPIPEMKKKMKYLLNRLADHLDLHVGADSLSEDFMSSRLPPYTQETEEDGEKEETKPTLSSHVKIKHREHVRLIIYSDDDDDDEDEDTDDDSVIEENDKNGNEEQSGSKKEEIIKSGKKGLPKTRSNSGAGKSPKAGKERTKSTEDVEMEGQSTSLEDDDDSGPHVTVLHSLSNDRKCHMVGEIQQGGIRLGLHFAKALQHLLDHHKDFVAVKDLPLLDDDDKEKMVEHLWSDGLLEVKC